jgi:hypothetical protein
MEVAVPRSNMACRAPTEITFPAKLKVEVAIDDDAEGALWVLILYFAALCFLAALAGWAG